MAEVKVKSPSEIRRPVEIAAEPSEIVEKSVAWRELGSKVSLYRLAVILEVLIPRAKRSVPFQPRPVNAMFAAVMLPADAVAPVVGLVVNKAPASVMP